MAGLLEKLIGHLLGGRRKPQPGPRPAPTPAPSPTPSPIPASTRDQELDSHNRYRAQAGLPPLAINAQLQAAAQAHADFMARVGKMAHQGIGDGDMATRLHAAGYLYGRAGENIAWNQPNVASVMTAWWGSPGHRANILGDYTEAGFAVAYGARKDPYWCSTFGASMGRASGAFGVALSQPDASHEHDSAASSMVAESLLC